MINDHIPLNRLSVWNRIFDRLALCFRRSYTAVFLDMIVLVRKYAVLSNPEWWEELFKFYPTFITWKLYISQYYAYALTEGTNNLYASIM